MPVVVRKLEPVEQENLRAIIVALDRHVNTCEVCRYSTDRSSMCDDGRALYARWDDWLADPAARS
jgi:hypothetical protein